MPPGSKPTIIDTTFFGNKISIDQYARNALQWAKRELVPNSPIFCPCLNDDIHFSNTKVGHTIMHKKYNQQANFNVECISILSQMPKIIANAQLRYSASDRKRRENVEVVHNLISEVNIDGHIRKVEVFVQEIYHEAEGVNRLHFYNHVLL